MCSHEFSVSRFVFILKSQIVIHQNHMDSSGMSGISCDQELAANGIRRLAVEAFSGCLARCFHLKTLGIRRSSYISGTLHRTVKICAYFIDSHNENNLLRTLGNAGYTVGISIDIHHNTIIRNCIRAA